MARQQAARDGRPPGRTDSHTSPCVRAIWTAATFSVSPAPRAPCAAGATLAGSALAQERTATVSADWRAFELTADISIEDPGAQARLWIPVPDSADTDYQRGAQTIWRIEGGGTASLAQAPGYGVRMLAAQWPENPDIRRITVISRFQTRNRRVDLDQPAPANFRPESAATLREYLKPTDLLPTDGIVKATADRITRGHSGDLARALAIYEWVVENTCRTASTRGCGVGDVRYMLTANDLNGKCADINALFVALARAAGIPARDAYGLRVADSQLGYRSLGKAGDVTRAQHCRAEFYAASHGWVPVDPADVRKVMLEEPPGELPINNPQVRGARDAVRRLGDELGGLQPRPRRGLARLRPRPGSFPDVSQWRDSRRAHGQPGPRQLPLPPDGAPAPGLTATDRPPCSAAATSCNRASRWPRCRWRRAPPRTTRSGPPPARTGRPGPRPRRR